MGGPLASRETRGLPAVRRQGSSRFDGRGPMFFNSVCPAGGTPALSPLCCPVPARRGETNRAASCQSRCVPVESFAAKNLAPGAAALSRP